MAEMLTKNVADFVVKHELQGFKEYIKSRLLLSCSLASSYFHKTCTGTFGITSNRRKYLNPNTASKYGKPDFNKGIFV